MSTSQQTTALVAVFSQQEISLMYGCLELEEKSTTVQHILETISSQQLIDNAIELMSLNIAEAGTLSQQIFKEIYQFSVRSDTYRK